MFCQPVKIIHSSRYVVFPGAEMEGNPVQNTFRIKLDVAKNPITLDSVIFSGYCFKPDTVLSLKKESTDLVIETFIYHDLKYRDNMPGMKAYGGTIRDEKYVQYAFTFTSIPDMSQIYPAVVLYYHFNNRSGKAKVDTYDFNKQDYAD